MIDYSIDYSTDISILGGGGGVLLVLVLIKYKIPDTNYFQDS